MQVVRNTTRTHTHTKQVRYEVLHQIITVVVFQHADNEKLLWAMLLNHMFSRRNFRQG